MGIILRITVGWVIVLSFQPLFANSLSNGSLASKRQIKSLNIYLMSIPSNDPKVNAIQLNKQLAKVGLPTINVNSPSFKVNLAYMVGFSGSHVIGAEFYDGKHKFCLPCTIGHNNFQWGITKHYLRSLNKSGDYYSYLQCLNHIPGSYIRVSHQKHSTTRFVAIPGKADGREGFYVYTDDKVYFYQAKMPELGQHFTSYLITLPDGVKSAVSFRIPYDPNRTVVQDRELQTREGNRQVLESMRESTDLGTGSRDKKTIESNNVLVRAIANQYENLLEANTLERIGISDSDICKSINICEKVKPLNKAQPDLTKFKTAFNCAVPQQRSNPLNINKANGSEDGSERAVR